MPIPYTELAIQSITSAGFLQTQKANLLPIVLRVLAEIVGIVTHFRLQLLALGTFPPENSIISWRQNLRGCLVGIQWNMLKGCLVNPWGWSWKSCPQRVQKSFCITVVPTMANYKLPQKYAKKTLSQNNDSHSNPLSQLLLTTKNNFTSIII